MLPTYIPDISYLTNLTKLDNLNFERGDSEDIKLPSNVNYNPINNTLPASLKVLSVTIERTEDISFKWIPESVSQLVITSGRQHIKITKQQMKQLSALTNLQKLHIPSN
jgi:hypothetical protein